MSLDGITITDGVSFIRWAHGYLEGRVSDHAGQSVFDAVKQELVTRDEQLAEAREKLDQADKELAEKREEYDDAMRLNGCLAGLLERTANALKGKPPEDTLHDWSDLPDVIEQKMAKAEALAANVAERLARLERLINLKD